MEYIEFKNIIKNYAEYNNLVIEEVKCQNLYKYMKNLLEWNKNINLTAIKGEKEIILKHFIDSIIIKDRIKGRVLDIGSGAGFPGIPLKIVNDEIKLVSIDSVNKKIKFQLDTVQKLKLKNIDCIHIRAEELANNIEYREKFDFVVTRALANMSTLVEYMIPFTKIGGRCICLKGPNCTEEIEKARKAINLLGGRIIKIENYKISQDNERVIILIEKIKNTPKMYPRKQGKPSKEPII